MKVFVLGTRGFPNVQGGIEAHCEHLYPRLAQHGCDIRVFTRSAYISRKQRSRHWRCVKFIHLWAPRNKYLEALVHTFLGVIISRAKSADCVHVHGIGPSLCIPLARVLGLRVVMTHHGPDYNRAKWGTFAKFILRLGESFGLRYAHRVIVVSRSILESLPLIYEKKRLVFIPNGVEQSVSSRKSTLLQKFGLAAQQYILAVARFVPEKGLHDLIEAYSRMRTDTTKLVIVGGPVHESAYSRSLRKTAETTNGVVLTGVLNRKQLPELYANTRLFVLPSYYEGLPISLLEAISYGAPVLVSDIAPHREIPLPGHRYFPAGNTQILVQKIAALCRTPKPHRETEDAKNMILETYNWDRIARATINVYSDLFA